MKRALVTGSSGGIGAGIAMKLAASGYFVYVHANSGIDRAEATLEMLRAAGGDGAVTAFDVTKAEASGEAIAKILEDGPIQVLVNNAGIHDDAPLAGMSLSSWQKVIDVSLHGFYNVTQPLLLPMMRTRWGRIISMSSVAAVAGNRGQTNYAAAKAGLHGASRSLSQEMASRGVTVNVVAPGVIDTPMTESVFSKDQIKGMVPMQRAGTVEEVAALVNFLASDDAGYITGQIISINGGMI